MNSQFHFVENKLCAVCVQNNVISVILQLELHWNRFFPINISWTLERICSPKPGKQMSIKHLGSAAEHGNCFPPLALACFLFLFAFFFSPKQRAVSEPPTLSILRLLFGKKRTLQIVGYRKNLDWNLDLNWLNHYFPVLL